MGKYSEARVQHLYAFSESVLCLAYTVTHALSHARLLALSLQNLRRAPNMGSLYRWAYSDSLSLVYRKALFLYTSPASELLSTPGKAPGDLTPTDNSVGRTPPTAAESHVVTTVCGLREEQLTWLACR